MILIDDLNNKINNTIKSDLFSWWIELLYGNHERDYINTSGDPTVICLDKLDKNELVIKYIDTIIKMRSRVAQSYLGKFQTWTDPSNLISLKPLLRERERESTKFTY